MRPTFMGLETAKRAMAAQQSALYTMGNNVANVNTPGYSRQRVNFATTSPYPTAGMNRPYMPGQLGTGVDAASVQRIRDPFLDVQFRKENNKLGYYGSRADALDKMQDIMNEPSDHGLAKVMDNFWQSLQDLATNPKDVGTRTVVVERAKAVAETFNYLSSNLTSFRGDLTSKLDHGVTEVNTLLNQINQVNEQIRSTEPHGTVPNDLYDQRDMLLDQLSQYVSIDVTYSSSGGHSSSLAEGIATITMKDKDGNNITLIDGKDATKKPAQFGKVEYAADGSVQSLGFTGTDGATKTIDAKDFGSMGSLKSYMDTIGYVGQEDTAFSYGSMLKELDKMAKDFATEFNKINKQGVDANGNPIAEDFFAGKDGAEITAANILVALTDPKKIGAETADGKNNAQELSKVFEGCIDSDGKKVGFTTYYQGVIGKMGVQAQEAERMESNSMTLALSVNKRRLSVSAVSQDEEFTNMVQFQHAYNAAARTVTMVDEMLEKVINGMGLVGR